MENSPDPVPERGYSQPEGAGRPGPGAAHPPPDLPPVQRGQADPPSRSFPSVFVPEPVMSSTPISSPLQVACSKQVCGALGPLNLAYRELSSLVGEFVNWATEEERLMGPAVGMEFGASLPTPLPAP